MKRSIACRFELLWQWQSILSIVLSWSKWRCSIEIFKLFDHFWTRSSSNLCRKMAMASKIWIQSPLECLLGTEQNLKNGTQEWKRAEIREMVSSCRAEFELTSRKFHYYQTESSILSSTLHILISTLPIYIILSHYRILALESFIKFAAKSVAFVLFVSFSYLSSHYLIYHYLLVISVYLFTGSLSLPSSSFSLCFSVTIFMIKESENQL